MLPNGKRYEFSHKKLGNLGRLLITGIGNQTLCTAEIAPGEVTDPKWQERFEIFSQIVKTCMEALPGKNEPLPELEEARQKVALYRRFIATQNSMDMERFAENLSDKEYEILLEMIQNAQGSSLALQDTDSLFGTAQRFTELQQFRGRRE
jgi:hypothetical protein